jgi:hypothetical protein
MAERAKPRRIEIETDAGHPREINAA